MPSFGALAVAFAALVAGAQPADRELRYCALFAETLDGGAVSSPFAERALVASLLESGVTFVDETQSRKIRSVLSARAIVDGGAKISEVVTSADADIVLGVVSRLGRIKSTMLHSSVHR